MHLFWGGAGEGGHSSAWSWIWVFFGMLSSITLLLLSLVLLVLSLYSDMWVPAPIFHPYIKKKKSPLVIPSLFWIALFSCPLSDFFPLIYCFLTLFEFYHNWILWTFLSFKQTFSGPFMYIGPSSNRSYPSFSFPSNVQLYQYQVRWYIVFQIIHLSKCR